MSIMERSDHWYKKIQREFIEEISELQKKIRQEMDKIYEERR